jgi:hypothetical protein
MLPLLVIGLRCFGPIGVTRLLVLCVPSVKGCFFYQGLLIGNDKHLFRRARILHGKLVDQHLVLETFLEEHND